MKSNMMRLLLHASLLVIFIGSCSSTNGPVIPPDTLAESGSGMVQQTTSPDTQSDRFLWGLYEWVVDLETETCEFVPLRDVTAHYNVVTDMNVYPPRVTFEEFVLDKPNNTISLDVLIHHPYPGRPDLDGFDVHGIMIGPGSMGGFDDPTLMVAGPDDPHIMNADGWTRWWNPVEFNIGNNLFSYTDGSKGVPYSVGNFNATLNAYKTFSDDLGNLEDISDINLSERMIFRTETIQSRHYDIWFPVVADKYVYRFNYAIDASWEPIPGYDFGDPVTAPGDWESGANQSEPFRAVVDIMQNDLYFAGSSVKGGVANLQVKVFDWQGYMDGGNVADEITSVKFECPGGYDGIVMGTMTDPGSSGLPYAIYEIDLDGEDLLTNQDCMMLLTIESANGNYQPSLTGYSGTAPLSFYQLSEMPAIAIEQPPPNELPVAVASMDAESEVKVGTTVIFDGSLSSDSDGSIVSYLWDFNNDGVYGDSFDGGTDTNPEVTFNTKGEYWIDLKVIDDGGSSDMLDLKLYLNVFASLFPLAEAEPFGSFGGGSGMTNEGILTIINGDIGTTGASTTMTGFHDSVGDIYTETPLNIGTVNGRIYTAPPSPGGAGVGGTAETYAIAAAAANATLILYNSISPASLPGGVDPGAGQLGGLTLAPGIYKAAGGTFLLTGSDLTLDGQGDPNAVWVFQCEAGLTVGAPGFPRSVILTNGAHPRNIFWYVGSAARIEDCCYMVGTIVASAGVTISTHDQMCLTTLDGRAMGLNASVTVVNTIINIPE